MLNKIKDILEKTIKENIDDKLKESVGDQKIGVKLPSISLENVSFEFSELGVGRKIEPENNITEFFNGDDKNNSFKLKELPLKPSLSVEYPIGNLLNENNYEIDYLNGVIKLDQTPITGKNNIKVTYTKPVEIRGIKLNMTYNINIWAEDETERDDITLKIVEILLKNEEKLNNQEIYLKPIKGYNIKSEQSTVQRYGKILEYLIEAEFEITVPSSRIEKVELSKPEKIS